jgi:zinc protease
MMDRLRDLRHLAGCFVMSIALTATLPPQTAHAAAVEEVVSDTGVRAYLITEPTIPFLALSLHVKGGAVYDPPGKEGLAYMVSGLLDEGAGEHDSQAFRTLIEDNAIRLSFDADRDGFTASLRTLTETRELAFELLRLALTEPRFDAEPVERIRGQILVELARRESSPDYLASKNWFAAAFEGHPYANPTRGSAETIAAITVEDLRDWTRQRMARDAIYLGVAGDITAVELKELMDRTFAGLPERAELPEIQPATPQLGETLVIRHPGTQSVVSFGQNGLARKDPDYYAAHIANYILGGGGFSSRLTEEVREKRGLVYSIYSYLYDTDYAPLWIGGFSTSNHQVQEALEITRHEVARLAEGDISAEDLENAKTYLTGSFPLRLTSNDQIARMLVGMLVHDLGIDFLERRNDYIEAVTLEDVRRVARRVFADPLLVTVVGEPQGLDG